MKYEKFEDLPIWKLSIEIGEMVFGLNGNEKISKEFSFLNQAKNYSININSSIVEGFENRKDFLKYLKTSSNYVQKLRSLIYLGKEIKLLSGKEFDNFNEKLTDLNNQIGGLLYYMKSKKTENYVEEIKK